jgi:hypothetical protein
LTCMRSHLPRAAFSRRGDSSGRSMSRTLHAHDYSKNSSNGASSVSTFLWFSTLIFIFFVSHSPHRCLNHAPHPSPVTLRGIYYPYLRPTTPTSISIHLHPHPCLLHCRPPRPYLCAPHPSRKICRRDKNRSLLRIHHDR